MNNFNDLRKLHSLQLYLADELKRICDKYGLRYFMIAGTLLGAVRHQGFIPWDDDMDFGMPREDYDRFLQICKSELDNTTFYLQTDEEHDYFFNFSKLSLTGTKIYPLVLQDSAINYYGIYIDIFPVDNIPQNKIKAFYQRNMFRLVKVLAKSKTAYRIQNRKKILGYRLASLFGRLFSEEKLKKWKYRIITMASNEYSKKVVVSEGAYGFIHETLERKWIEDICDYRFEDRVLPGIRDHHDYLSYFYGDYMKLPPEGDRNHHGRLKIEYGKYND